MGFRYPWLCRSQHLLTRPFQQELNYLRMLVGDFFGVDTTYFSDSEEGSEVELSTQRGRYVDEIQARAYQMDERSRKAILDMMDFILSTQKSELPGDIDSGTKRPGEENPE
jgi:hypothetical protein